MTSIANHIQDLKQVGFYMAPDNAQVTPVRIPDRIELVELLTGGEVAFEVNNEMRTFGKGTIFWHKAGEETIWRTQPSAPYRCAVFMFSVNDLMRPVPRVSFWNSDSDTDIDRFTSECLDLFHKQELSKSILGLYIYSTLLRHALVVGKASGPHDVPRTIELALDYITQNIRLRFSIEELARHCQISPPHLFKLFQTYLGTSPHRYILTQQLSRARTLLAGSQQTIKEIAAECGFESLEVFYRRFRRESGMPPGEYRQKYQPYSFSKK
jgi:AraC-like DNA-binding protein